MIRGRIVCSRGINYLREQPEMRTTRIGLHQGLNLVRRALGGVVYP